LKTLLTERALRALKPAPAGKRITMWDAGLSGFGLRVTDRGAISFHVMRRLPGKPHPVRVVLGKYPSLSLAAARKQASAALGDLAAGIHPRERARALQTAEAQRKAVTVGHVVEEFASRHLSRKRTGHGVGQLLRRELVSRWGDRPITDINRADVIGMIEAIGDRSPSVARRTWVYTRRLFGWALSRDVYGLTASPCERIRVADLIGSPKPRERVLDADELRAIWQITATGEFPFDPFVRLLLLLGCRRGELAGMRRDELDLAAGLWHLSGGRTKNELPRTIPLSRQAVAILAVLPVFPGPLVFSADGGVRPIQGFSKFKLRFDRRLAAIVSVPNWTLHDLRRTMRTHLSALPISGVVAELMIGHKQRGIRAVYDRFAYLDEQRSAFELWAARLRDVVEPPPGNVVLLREAGH
jgi:integrase